MISRVNNEGVMFNTVTLASGATGLSEAIYVGDKVIGCIIMPTTWVTAALSFAVCDTLDGTFVPLYDEYGSEVQLVVTANIAIAVGNYLAAAPFIKLRSGVVATPVDQTAARTFKFILK